MNLHDIDDRGMSNTTVTREADLRTIIDALPAAVYMTDASGCITYFNPACVQMSGRMPELGTDRWCVTWKLFRPDGTPLPHHECPMAVAIKTGRAVRGEVAIAERPDGTRIWFEPHPTPLFDDDGNLIGGVNMLVDITERKLAEQQLRATEQRYHQLLELLPVAVYTCKAPSGEITFYNDYAAKLWGRTPPVNGTTERFCGSFKMFRPDGTPIPHDQCPMAIAMREAKSFRNVNVDLARPDGTRISALVNIDPIRDEHGNVVGAVNAFSEVTALKQAETVAAKLAAIVESSDDAIVSKNLNGIILSWNRGAERIFGYSASEAIGQSITMLIPTERLDEEPHIIEQVRSGKRVDHYETVRRRKDGSLIDISLTVSPIKDGEGRIIGASKIARDISDRKRAESERAQYAARLEEALARRSQELMEAHEVRRRSEAMAILGALSAGIAHDLSNLLLPMRTRISLMQQMADLPEEVSEHLASMAKHVEYIGQLGQRVRQYMNDAAKQTSDVADTHAELIELTSWCRQVQPFLQSVLASDSDAGIDLQCAIPSSLPKLLLNKTGLTQSVYNLVQNAVKAIRSSGVGSLIRVRAWSDRPEFVYVSVEDDGPGMPADILARCGGPQPSNGSGRSGMGLSLVKAFCDQFGGEMRVFSPAPPVESGSSQQPLSTAVVMRFSVPEGYESQLPQRN